MLRTWNFWKTDTWKINKNSPNGLVDVSWFAWEPQKQARFPSTNFGQRLRSLLALGLALKEGAEKWTMPSCWMETCGWQHGPQWLGPSGCHPQSGNDVTGMPVEPFKTLKPYFVQRIPHGIAVFSRGSWECCWYSNDIMTSFKTHRSASFFWRKSPPLLYSVISLVFRADPGSVTQRSKKAWPAAPRTIVLGKALLTLSSTWRYGPITT